MSHALIWFCIGLACLVGEAFTPGFVLMFFGVGALTAALLSLFVQDTATAFVVFSVVSVGSLLFLRSRVLRMLQGWSHKAGPTEKAAQTGQTLQMGRNGIVSRSIPAEGEGEGEVALGGSYWRAISAAPMAEGTSVRVIGHAADNELTLRVEPAATAHPHADKVTAATEQD